MTIPGGENMDNNDNNKNRNRTNERDNSFNIGEMLLEY